MSVKKHYTLTIGGNEIVISDDEAREIWSALNKDYGGRDKPPPFLPYPDYQRPYWLSDGPTITCVGPTS